MRMIATWLRHTAVLATLVLAGCGGGSGGTTATAPSAPTGLAATAGSPTSVSLSWTAASGAASYTVYRDGTSVGTSTATAYTDSSVTAATTYTYSVATKGSDGLSSAPGTTVSVTTPPAVPAPPTGLSASAESSSSIRLAWAPTTGATAYVVLRDGRPVTTTTGETYLNTSLAASTTYTYTLEAQNSSGTSAPSAEASATTAAALPVSPAAPTGLYAAATSNSAVTLTWSPVGATQTGAVSYRVYRNGGVVAIGTSATASYSDSGLAQATLYSYTVQAYDSVGHASPQSAAATVTTPGPTVPTGLVATPASNTSISLSWNAATDTLPLSGYRVYRDGNALSASITTNAYTDTGLTQATSHSYSVLAFDANYQSTPGASATATTQGPTAPVLSVASTNMSSVSLTWTAATDQLGVQGYRLYRQRAGTAGIGSLVVSTTNLSYTDAGIPLAGAYAYTLIAFDSANYTATSNVATSGTVTSPSPITISPRQVALTLMQTQQYSATVGGQPVTGAVTWSVDGTAGGNATIGTISAGGLYTPPATAGTHSITATSGANSSTQAASVAVTDLGGVYTYHADNARTGQNLHEYALTTTTVAPGNFGRLFSCPLDGDVYAQPLYVANVSIGGGVHNVIYVVTMNDSAYAIDADNTSCVVYWQTGYSTKSSVIPVPVSVINTSPGVCPDISNQYGITGTPVIDPSSNTIYFVTKTQETAPTNPTYVQRIHALDLATGIDRVTQPAGAAVPGVVISASVSGANGTVSFNPLWENQRAGLALANGQVYVSWSSHCDLSNWWGWVIAYDATTLAQTAVFNDAPNGNSGGIWMSGAAPAIDSLNNLYLTTGNGTFDYKTAIVPPLAPPNNDYGESYLKLAMTKSGSTSTIAVTDFYTPSQNAAWTTDDYDLSSSGVVVLPDGAGPSNHPNVVVGSDKQGHLWMLDRSAPATTPGTSMGGFSPTTEQVVQYLNLPELGNCGAGTVDGSPSFWNNTIYIGINGGPILSVALSGGLMPTTGSGTPPKVAYGARSTERYNFPMPTPMISGSSATSGAILWALDNNANGTDNCNGALGPAILRAYDATTMATLYDSSKQSGDAAGNAIKFTLPVIANGHVYVAGSSLLTVYGLLP